MADFIIRIEEWFYTAIFSLIALVCSKKLQQWIFEKIADNYLILGEESEESLDK